MFKSKGIIIVENILTPSSGVTTVRDIMSGLGELNSSVEK